MPVALIVEDDRDIRTLLHETLAGNGISTLLAASVPEAEALLEANTPDIALIDMNLAGRPGTDVLAYINQSPRLANMRRIVVTANPLTESGAEALGIDLFVLKPFSITDLVVLIWRLMPRHKPDQNEPSGR
jgi:CheY-like chemotaxis protein